MTDTENATLYQRLGGYDAIAAVADELLRRLIADARLGRFWQHRGDDGVRREKQLLISFLCECSGGPMVYVGRDMTVTHRGMNVSHDDWDVFVGHLRGVLEHFKAGERERNDVLAFVESLKSDIVEA